MSPELRKRIQITLIIFFVLALVRIAFIYHERHEEGVSRRQQQPVSSYKITSDDYVTPPKVFPYDTKSAAKELAGKAVWVRTGNQLAYYPYVAAGRSADFSHQAGLLGPLEKLEIKDAVLQTPPKAGNQKQVFAVFSKAGEPRLYAAMIGAEQNGTYSFYINDEFFLDDPHKLYAHWPAEVWSAIDTHEVKTGMNELQASFAVGTAANAGPGEIGSRSMEYSNNGKPVTVIFENNKAVSVTPGQTQ